MKEPLVKLRSLFRINIAVVTLLFISIALFFTLLSYIKNDRVNAAPVTNFNAGNIIDDSVFYNKNSMDVQQIQTFLNRLIPNCDVWGASASEYGGGTRAQYAASRGWQNPPYPCLNVYYENPNNGETSYEKGGGAFAGGISAAQIIYNAAQQYGINPQVLLVMLKKESAGPLTSDTWPLKSQYKYAMGYACPDSGPNYSAACDSGKAGFYKQMMTAAWQLNYYKQHPNDYRYHIGWNDIQYSTDPACGTKRVYIENIATLSLYIYTPYTPNDGALYNYPGTAPCGAYGNRNFYQFFSEWFGTTRGFIVNGVDYSSAFNFSYYTNTYPDVKAAYGNDQIAAFNHFLYAGIYEGRQGNSTFNVNSYRTNNADLRAAFGTDLQKYIRHYVTVGRFEGRSAIGDYRSGTPLYNGVDYSSVYNFDYYTRANQDVWNTYGLDDKATLLHFLFNGVYEGRQAISNFNTNAYRTRYSDLRTVYGSNIQKYLWHYATNGKQEGRIGTGDYRGGTTVYNGIDYSSVYNFDYYTRTNPDIWSVYGLDDKATLKHFLFNGIYEDRRGIIDFSVNAYRTRYADLRAAYGSDLQKYAWHYATNGKQEGRIGI
jgi:hypothetical protein